MDSFIEKFERIIQPIVLEIGPIDIYPEIYEDSNANETLSMRIDFELFSGQTWILPEVLKKIAVALHEIGLPLLGIPRFERELDNSDSELNFIAH